MEELPIRQPSAEPGGHDNPKAGPRRQPTEDIECDQDAARGGRRLAHSDQQGYSNEDQHGPTKGPNTAVGAEDSPKIEIRRGPGRDDVPASARYVQDPYEERYDGDGFLQPTSGSMSVSSVSSNSVLYAPVVRSRGLLRLPEPGGKDLFDKLCHLETAQMTIQPFAQQTVVGSMHMADVGPDSQLH